MSWQISRYRAGDLVRIRSKAEILATLDETGSVDGMPFMPEMSQYCGRIVPVAAVAHKTCDTAHRTHKNRRLDSTVHLAGLRCDGSAHGGCEAACNLFWNDAWLEPASGDDSPPPVATPSAEGPDTSRLTAACRLAPVPGSSDHEPTYSCQATKLFEATRELQWWNPRQYALDITTGNFSLAHVLRAMFLAALRRLIDISPVGYRALKALHRRAHQLLMKRDVPDLLGTVPPKSPTPTARLNFQPGERVRVKSKAEIEATLDALGRNRGMRFDVEMARYCGQTATVKSSVTRIIDEQTGKMRLMKEPCIILAGVVCMAEYSECRLMCPRAIPSYWREIWLERVGVNAPAALPSFDEARAAVSSLA